MKAVIFDVDGTLADCEHRRHFVEKQPKDWDSFFDPELVMKDKPIDPIVTLNHLCYSDYYRILIVTGRSERDRDVTTRWLDKHGIYYDQIYMRALDDKREDSIVKREILQQIRQEGCAVEMVFDDRANVVKMWREEGLLCLQVAEGNF